MLEELAGSATGVFVGVLTLDYGQLQFSGAEKAGQISGRTPNFTIAAEAHRAISGRHMAGTVVLIT